MSVHRRGEEDEVEEKKLILVADDDQSIRGLLQSFLEGEGFRTAEVKSGREVIPAINKLRPDLVMMDVRMPGMSGLEVLEQMKRLHIEDVPVLTMTAYGTSNIAIEAIQRGAYDYVTKPFALDDLLMTVNRTLDHRALALRVRDVVETIRDPWTASSAIRRLCNRCTKPSDEWLAPTRQCWSPGRAGPGRNWWPERFTSIQTAALAPTLKSPAPR
jgi:DNA-binding NtrC family response regulator